MARSEPELPVQVSAGSSPSAESAERPHARTTAIAKNPWRGSTKLASFQASRTLVSLWTLINRTMHKPSGFETRNLFSFFKCVCVQPKVRFVVCRFPHFTSIIFFESRDEGLQGIGTRPQSLSDLGEHLRHVESTQNFGSVRAFVKHSLSRGGGKA